MVEYFFLFFFTAIGFSLFSVLTLESVVFVALWENRWKTRESWENCAQNCIDQNTSAYTDHVFIEIDMDLYCLLAYSILFSYFKT